MGQSPDNGIAILKQFKTIHPTVPFVFYSRKITPEDVVRVLEEGAFDAIRKGALTDEQVLARLADTIQKANDRKAARLEPTQPQQMERKSSSAEPEPSASVHEGFSVRPTGIASWINVGTKVFALVAGLFSFLLARGKFLDWLKGSHGLSPTVLHPTSGSAVVGILFSLYLIVHFLFVAGGVLERVSSEIMKLAVATLRLLPSLKSKLTQDLTDSLKRSVPNIVRLTWDICVVVFAVIPALRYTVQLLASVWP
jgi:hypothetical protein